MYNYTGDKSLETLIPLVKGKLDDESLYLEQEMSELEDRVAIDISAEGNPVRVDGCLDGVPFNSVEVIGKNLVVAEWVHGYVHSTENLIRCIDSNAGRMWYAKVEEDTDYIISMKGTHTRCLIGFTAEYPYDNIPCISKLSLSADLTEYAIHVPVGAKYVAIYLTHENYDALSDVQVELGSVATAYEPYIIGRNITLSVGGKNLFEAYENYSAYGGMSSGYRIRSNANSYCFVSEIENNTDYVIRSFSDGNRMIVILFKEYPVRTTALREFDRVIWKTDSAITEEDKTVMFNSGDYNYATLTIAANDPNIDSIIKAGFLGTELPKPYNIIPTTTPYIVPFDIIQNEETNFFLSVNSKIRVNAVKNNQTIESIFKSPDKLLTRKGETNDSVTIEDLQGGVPFNDVTISGTNLIPFPYVMSNTDPYAQTFSISTINSVATRNDDGTVTFVADSTTQRGNFYPFFISGTNGERYTPLKNKRYYVYIETEGNLEIGLQCVYYKNDSQVTVEYTYGKGIDNSDGKYDLVRINPWISTGHPVEAGVHYEVTAKFMFVEGAEKVDYVSPLSGLTLTANGVDYGITPTVIPYTVPQDIIQAEGKNTLSIAGVGNPVLYVEGNKKNSQLAKVYDTIANLEYLIETEILDVSSVLESRLKGEM